jgi:hypothetical protein
MFISPSMRGLAVVSHGLNGYVLSYWTKDHKHIEIEVRITGESLYPRYRLVFEDVDLLPRKLGTV